MSGRDDLRVLWSEGLRVVRRPGGSLSLAPSDRVTPDLMQMAKDAKPEIEAVVRSLPSPNCCAICGTPVDADGKSETHCTDCALIAIERMALAGDIAQQGARYAA